MNLFKHITRSEMEKSLLYAIYTSILCISIWVVFYAVQSATPHFNTLSPSYSTIYSFFFNALEKDIVIKKHQILNNRYEIYCKKCLIDIGQDSPKSIELDIKQYTEINNEDKSITIRFPPGYTRESENSYTIQKSNDLKQILLYNSKTNDYKSIEFFHKQYELNTFNYNNLLMTTASFLLINIFVGIVFIFFHDFLLWCLPKKDVDIFEDFIEIKKRNINNQDDYLKFIKKVNTFCSKAYLTIEEMRAIYDKQYFEIFAKHFNHKETHSFLFIESFKGDMNYFHTIHDYFLKNNISYTENKIIPYFIEFLDSEGNWNDYNIIEKYESLLKNYHFPTTNDFLLEMTKLRSHDFSQKIFFNTFHHLSIKDLQIFMRNNKEESQYIEPIYQQRILGSMVAQDNSKRNIVKI